jgi:parvulin-like peptidyl-prolyl isomerase
MFKEPAEVKARHILVKTEAEAKKLINQLRKVPKNKLEEKFIELAKEHSIGPSKTQGGELGWFSKGKMIPAFSDAAFNLNKGNITLQPVKTRFGWHVIYVEDKKEGGYTPFEEVKEKIKEQLKFKRLKQYIDSVKNSANIEYKQ